MCGCTPMAPPSVRPRDPSSVRGVNTDPLFPVGRHTAGGLRHLSQPRSTYSSIKLTTALNAA